MKKTSDDAFASAFAPLLQVWQRGVMRPATAADVLELLSSGGRRYVLKRGDGQYLAKEGKGFSPHPRDAVVIPELEYAREMRDMGLNDYGVRTKVVRWRRKGTAGLEAVRLRPDIDVTTDSERLSLSLSNPEAMALLTALTGAKEAETEQ
jgi:hypothetical protein